jgi:hypothetical protein
MELGRVSMVLRGSLGWGGGDVPVLVAGADGAELEFERVVGHGMGICGRGWACVGCAVQQRLHGRRRRWWRSRRRLRGLRPRCSPTQARVGHGGRWEARMVFDTNERWRKHVRCEAR